MSEIRLRYQEFRSENTGIQEGCADEVLAGFKVGIDQPGNEFPGDIDFRGQMNGWI
jgi:hypothetical protein